MRILQVANGFPPTAMAGVAAYRLSQWRERFLAGGREALRTRPREVVEAELEAARAKVGELSMRLELYQKKRELLASRKRHEGSQGPGARPLAGSIRCV